MASDSKYAIEMAEKYAKEKNQFLAKSDHDNNPLHLDIASRKGTGYDIEEYYDTFVDLWIMGSARCLTHGVGGFGVFAKLMSFDPQCSSHHESKEGGMKPCEWQSI